jgi:hypothetical protein
MGIKERLKRLLQSTPPPPAPTDEQSQLLNRLFVEARAATAQSAWYYDITYSQLPAYQELKQRAPAWRKTFLFRTLDRLVSNTYPAEVRRLDETKQRNYYGIRYAHERLYELLIRSNYPFTEEELLQLFSTYRSGSPKTYPNFSSWPLGSTFRHVDRYVKQHGFTESLGKKLRGMLAWPELHVNPHGYIAEAVTKLRNRIELLLEEAMNDSARPVPYRLPTDRLGAVIESSLATLPMSERDEWHRLFHHCGKATAGRPSKKFRKEARELTDRIGTDAHRSLVRQWVDFVAGLDPESVRSLSGNDRAPAEYYLHDALLDKDAAQLLKGLIWTLVRYHDRETLAAVGRMAERAYRKIPGVGPAAAAPGNACLYVLAHSKGAEGLSHLSRLKQRVTQTNTRKLIGRYLEEAAERQGLTIDRLEERVVPDFGLVDGGKEVRFGDYTLRIRILELGKVEQRWIRPDGKTQKSVPSAVKDSAQHQKRLKKERATVALIKKQLTAQRDRIDRLFRADRSWKYADFIRYYLEHGLLTFLSQRLIWIIETEGSPVTVLRREGSWTNVSGTVIPEPAPESTITLWHPIDGSRDEVLAWRDRLLGLEVKQPLKQAYREIYLLTDAEVNTRTYSNRMAAHLLKQHQFNALAKQRGWTYSLLGAFDHGMWDVPASVELPHYGITAEFRVDEVNSENDMTAVGMWSYVATDQVKFRRTENEGENDYLNLVDVPPLAFSEVMRDVDLFVGVCSVGNDPQWRDNGGLRQYRDYWTNYSFGDLNEVANTRRDILEKLLPRLKIAAVSRIDGRFLRVRGKLREYKIHLGSTNILMEPNDQYLCIVPGRGSSLKSNIYLPFEGDRGLSIIISKAFLLAKDREIDDPTITSQIRRR